MGEALDFLHLLNSGNEINNLLPGNFDYSQFKVWLSHIQLNSQVNVCLWRFVFLCRSGHDYQVVLCSHAQQFACCPNSTAGKMWFGLCCGYGSLIWRCYSSCIIGTGQAIPVRSTFITHCILTYINTVIAHCIHLHSVIAHCMCACLSMFLLLSLACVVVVFAWIHGCSRCMKKFTSKWTGLLFSSTRGSSIGQTI